MPTLQRRLNYRLVELGAEAGDTVGVHFRGGNVKQVRWLGFITRGDARLIRGARPVKLDVVRYTNDTSQGGDWRDVEPGSYVQGCLTDKGAFAVVTSTVRIVSSNDASPDAANVFRIAAAE